MPRAIGLTRLQQDALNRHLACGRYSWNGMALNGIVAGLCESFQGKMLMYENGGTLALTQGGVNGTYINYVWGANQILSVRSSTTSAVTGTGFPDASAPSHRGRLVLSNPDSGSCAMAMMQENQLWIPNAAPFQVCFDVAAWEGRSNAVGVSFIELGVMGDQATAADVKVFSKEPADGNPFLEVKMYNGMGLIRRRAAASGAITSSSVFDVPVGAFSLRIEHNYSNSTGHTTVYVNDQVKTNLAGSVTGPFQVFARTCHGASYASGTHEPALLSLDGVMATVPLDFGE